MVAFADTGQRAGERLVPPFAQGADDRPKPPTAVVTTRDNHVRRHVGTVGSDHDKHTALRASDRTGYPGLRWMTRPGEAEWLATC